MTAAERDELETLREENRQLRALLLPEAVFPPHCRPDPTEQKAALAIRAASPGLASRERVHMAMYGDRADGGPVSRNIVDVYMSRLRKRLAGTGVTIETVYQRGWYMDAASAARFDELLACGRLTSDQVTEGTR